MKESQNLILWFIATVIKTVWYWRGAETSKKYKQTYIGKNWFLTKVQKQFNGGRIEDSFYNKEYGLQFAKRMDLNLNLTPYTEINTKWIIHLHVKCKAIKLIEASRISSWLWWRALGTPKVHYTHKRKDTLDFFKILLWKVLREWKYKSQTGQKYLQIIYPTTNLSRKYIKNFLISKVRKQMVLLKNMNFQFPLFHSSKMSGGRI